MSLAHAAAHPEAELLIAAAALQSPSGPFVSFGRERRRHRRVATARPPWRPDLMFFTFAARKSTLASSPRTVAHLRVISDVRTSSEPRWPGDTVLHEAAAFDELDLFQAALTAGLSCLTANLRGQLPLHRAAAANSLRVLAFLAETLPLEQLNAANGWGETALHLSAAAGHARAVALLTGAGADQTLRDRWGRVPFDVAHDHGETNVCSLLTPAPAPAAAAAADGAQTGGMPTAVRDEMVLRIAQRASREGEPLAAPEAVVAATVPPAGPARAPNRSVRSLSQSVEFPGDVAMVQAFIAKAAADPERFSIGGRDMYGYTALHKFAAWDQPELISLVAPLLSAEEINATAGADGFHALHSCIDMGSERALRALLAVTVRSPLCGLAAPCVTATLRLRRSGSISQTRREEPPCSWPARSHRV
jgi:ankyrin repeat protein